MKNGYKITDSHAHIFPDKIAEKATVGISKFYDLPMEYHGMVSEMLQAGEQAGIDHYLVCSPATTIPQVHSINAFLASVEAAYPCCTAFGTLHPESPTMEEDLEELLKFHLHGVKLHPDFQNFPIDDPAAYPMYDMISQSGLPILMHMGDSRTDLSHPMRLAVVLKQFPKLKIIAAHLGGWGRWEDAFQYIPVDDRIRFDTSSSLPFIPQEQVKKLIYHFGTDHCFFGVDYPMWDYNGELERFFSLQLTDTENRMILSENLDDFLGL